MIELLSIAKGVVMSIKGSITSHNNGDIIIEMEGGLNYENSIPLREDLVEIVNNNPDSNITINFDNVDFVGSSGIGNFVETINHINKNDTVIKLSNVKSEFLKVFKLYNLHSLETAIDDFDQEKLETSSLRTSSKRVFEN